MEQCIAQKGSYSVSAEIIREEGTVFVYIADRAGNMSSIEAFESVLGFEDDRGYHVPAPASVCAWVARNIDGWYEQANNILGQGVAQ